MPMLTILDAPEPVEIPVTMHRAVYTALKRTKERASEIDAVTLLRAIEPRLSLKQALSIVRTMW